MRPPGRFVACSVCFVLHRDQLRCSCDVIALYFWCIAMDIKLFFEEGAGSENIRTMMHDFVSSAATKAGVSSSTIKTVGLATEETYAEAVNELFPGSGYTNNKEYLGVGKTETLLTPSGPEHQILFNAYVFELCLQGSLGVGENVVEWPADLQYGPYIISHEIGHCRFNETAPRDVGLLNTLRMQNDDFDSINDHQFSVLVGEVGACYYGDRYYTEHLFEHACEQELSPLGNLRRDITAAKSENDIQGVAYLANGLSWLYPIQYSKIALGMMDTSLADVPIHAPNELSNFAEVHNLLSHGLTEFCSSNLTDINGFRENINLVRELLLEQYLNVKISKDGNDWSCYWS